MIWSHKKSSDKKFHDHIWVNRVTEHDDSYGTGHYLGATSASARPTRPSPFDPLPDPYGTVSSIYRQGLQTTIPPLFDDRPPPANSNTAGHSRAVHGAVNLTSRTETLPIRISSSRVNGSTAVEPRRESRHERTPTMAPSRTEGKKPAKPHYESNNARNPDVGPSRGGKTRPVIDERTRNDEAVARRLAQQYEQAYHQEAYEASQRYLQRVEERGSRHHEDHGRRRDDERPRAPREHGDTKGKGKARAEPEPEPKPKPKPKPKVKPKTGHIRECRVCMDDFDKSELLSPCDLSHRHYYCKDCLERKSPSCLRLIVSLRLTKLLVKQEVLRVKERPLSAVITKSLSTSIGSLMIWIRMW